MRAALILLISFAASAAPPPIPWHSSPTTAAAVARAQQKVLLVYLRDGACERCNVREDAWFTVAAADPLFQHTLDAFLPLRLTTGQVPPEHAIVNQLTRRRKPPVVGIFDASGVPLEVFEKLPTKWTPVGEELLRFRSRRELLARGVELRLAGQTALADYATGNALLDLAHWRAAVERLDKAIEGFAKAGEKENEQLARVFAAYARYGAGQKDRGRTEIAEILEAPLADAVAAEAHLANGGIYESQARTASRTLAADPGPLGVDRRRRRREDVAGANARRSDVVVNLDRRNLALAVESYRKAYELAAPGTRTLELAKEALARVDDRPMPPKDGDARALRIVPPARQTLTGPAEFLVEAPSGVERIDFYLDEKKMASATKPPYRATFDVGSTPRLRTVRALAFGAGETLRGEAMVTINDRVDAFLVSIVSPAGARIDNAADVDVGVRIPPGRSLARLEISWNDRLLATLTAPPYRARVEAGGAFGYLRALGTLDDGTTAEATRLYNSGAMSAEVEVGAVNVIATVTNAAGRRMRGLTSEDFVIEDEGQRVAATLRSSEDEPVTIGVAVDSSSSMKGKQLYVMQAAAQLVERALRPQDQAFLVAFDLRVRLAHPRSNDAASLRRAIFDLVATGGTSIFDGVTFALQQFQGVAGKKALVVLTDGREGTSSASAKECERLARALGVPVYVFVPEGGERQAHALREISEATGGVLYHSAAVAALPALFDLLADELRGQYVLSFTRPPGVAAGSWRTIRVSVPGRDANVRTIQGYRAN